MLPYDSKNHTKVADNVFLQEIRKYSLVDLEVRSRILNWAATRRFAPREEITRKSRDKNSYVFSYWHSGADSSPPIVKACIKSHQKYFGDSYVLLNSDNIADWIEIPKRVTSLRSRISQTQFSQTQFSEILRLMLLESYGGAWVDSTVLLTDQPIFHSDLDFFCFSKPSEPRLLSSWWIEARFGSYIVERWLDYLLAYWDQHDYLIDYFIMHYLFEALHVLDTNFRELWNSVPAVSANPPHLLQSILCCPHDPKNFKTILDQSNTHKLTWKLPDEMSENSTLEFLLNTIEKS